jgi:hypothetical protein
MLPQRIGRYDITAELGRAWTVALVGLSSIRGRVAAGIFATFGLAGIARIGPAPVDAAAALVASGAGPWSNSPAAPVRILQTEPSAGVARFATPVPHHIRRTA